ncbi:hypothetical protein [Clostridium sp. DL1XJH146]
MFLVIIITYINIYNFLLYKSNKDVGVNTNNFSEELGEEELLKVQRENIEKELYAKLSDDNILIEELNKKGDGNINCSIMILGKEEKQNLLLEELSEIPFLAIKNIGFSYNSDNSPELRAKFELK